MRRHLMRVTVDENSCEANGFCESLAPDVFELGDEDVVQIADGPVAADREIDVRAAVEQCPKAALRLQD
jgi:ferredoxin